MLLGILGVHNVGNYRFGRLCPSCTVQHTLKRPLVFFTFSRVPRLTGIYTWLRLPLQIPSASPLQTELSQRSKRKQRELSQRCEQEASELKELSQRSKEAKDVSPTGSGTEPSEGEIDVFSHSIDEVKEATSIDEVKVKEAESQEIANLTTQAFVSRRKSPEEIANPTTQAVYSSENSQKEVANPTTQAVDSRETSGKGVTRSLLRSPSKRMSAVFMRDLTLPDGSPKREPPSSPTSPGYTKAFPIYKPQVCRRDCSAQQS